MVYKILYLTNHGVHHTKLHSEGILGKLGL